MIENFYDGHLNLPSFLHGPEATDEEAETLYDYSSNWVKLHEVFRADVLTEEDLRKLMILELRTRRRMDILSRIKTLFSKLREEREKTEILAVYSIREEDARKAS